VSFAKRAVAGLASVALAAVGWTMATGTPAFALGPGEVCVFLEPNGAEIPVLGAVGHIGWGYLVAGSPTWVYGSTENPNGDYQINAPAINGAWSANGTFQEMINDFTFQPHFPATTKQPRPAHQYTEYKCRKTSTSSVGAANTAAAANRTAGYTGIGNNCLNATVRVLGAYGTPNLPSPTLNPYPNDWYDILGSPDWWPGALG
jgi:hypothetical protein